MSCRLCAHDVSAREFPHACPRCGAWQDEPLNPMRAKASLQTYSLAYVVVNGVRLDGFDRVSFKR